MEGIIIVAVFIVVLYIIYNTSSKPRDQSNTTIPKSVRDIPIEDREIVSVSAVPPTTKNEFKFYEFVSTFDYIDQYHAEMKRQGYNFPPEYESAILFKIKNGYYNNPFTFPEYFNSKFDFIAIDFETANNNRISACALGLVFVIDNIIVHQFKEYIKPPISEKFLGTHTKIHGITSSDVQYAKNFRQIWDEKLSKYLTKNLIVCHNTSMDISIMCQLASYYNIEEFDIEYIDTMAIANGEGLPTKLEALATHFDLEYDDLHDPEKDAQLCAEVYNELLDIVPDISIYKRRAFPSEVTKPSYRRGALNIKGDRESNKIIRKYRVTKTDMEQFQISNKAFLITGELSDYRENFHDLIESMGGLVKKGVSSKVDYVIVGEDYGWSKIEKVDEYNSAGKAAIRFLNEDDFNIGLTLLKQN